MNTQNLAILIDYNRQLQDELLRTKGNDYTLANEDRCWNFKTVAKELGITPMQAWGVYWLKHVFAIESYVKFGSVKSEEIEGRFVDLINYCYLGLALIQDAADERTAEALAEDTEAKKADAAEAVSTLQRDRPSRSDASSAESHEDGSHSALRPLSSGAL